MKAKILSLNIGLPQVTEWNGKAVETSMLKTSVSELNVHELSVDGDRFADPRFHGRPDSVLYAIGVDLLDDYFARIGQTYQFGDLGENITLDRLDEREISVSDIFRIGEVLAQATFPRIPCAKLNFRVRNALGQRTMIETKRSGVYFRILKPGLIRAGDVFERFEQSETPFSIFEVYAKMVGGVKVTDADRARVNANDAFPLDRIGRWFAAGHA